jgi:hypothetical protein
MDYWLWSFDYRLNQRVFLGRQVRVTDYEDTMVRAAPPTLPDQNMNHHDNDNNNTSTTTVITKYRYGYHVGMSPRYPNQTWQIHSLPAAATTTATTTTTATASPLLSQSSSSSLETATATTTRPMSSLSSTPATPTTTTLERGMVVPWNTTIRLSVGGTHPKLEQPNSHQRQWLSAPPRSQVLQNHNNNNNNRRHTRTTRGVGNTHHNNTNNNDNTTDDENDDNENNIEESTNDNNNRNTVASSLTFWYATRDQVSAGPLNGGHTGNMTGDDDNIHDNDDDSQDNWNDETHLQLVPYQDYDLYQQQRRRRHRYKVYVSNTTTIPPSPSSSSSPSSLAQTDFGYQLTTYPIPEVCDKGLYLLYSPDQLRLPSSPPRTLSLRDNSNSSSRSESASHEEEENETQNHDSYDHDYSYNPTAYPGAHAHVSFLFFTQDGMMYLRALNLRFWLGIPILLEDSNAIVGCQPSSPLLGLFHKRSSRWGCIKYYFATSADVQEGTPLNLQDFLARVTDHDDHSVLQKKMSVTRPWQRTSSSRARRRRRRRRRRHIATRPTTTTAGMATMGREGNNPNGSDNGHNSDDATIGDYDFDEDSDDEDQDQEEDHGSSNGSRNHSSTLNHSHHEVDEEEEDLVYIYVKDAILDKSTPDFPLDDSQIWQFVLC